MIEPRHGADMTGFSSSPMSAREVRGARRRSLRVIKQAQARGKRAVKGTQNIPRPLASLTKLYGTFWPTSSLSVSTVANAAVSATP